MYQLQQEAPHPRRITCTREVGITAFGFIQSGNSMSVLNCVQPKEWFLGTLCAVIRVSSLGGAGTQKSTCSKDGI